MARKVLDNPKNARHDKTLTDFYEDIGGEVLKEPRIIQMLGEEDAAFKKAVKNKEASEEFFEDHCYSIFSKICDELDIKGTTYDKDAYLKFVAVHTLDFLTYIKINEAFKEVAFAAVAENPEGITYYVDGKKLLPPGPHKKGYSVGVVPKREEK
ncbi:MAG: hypothetical protein BK997_01740 [Candidatus Micrarchaeum sp. ARMAN-1]|jgi:hypothetical protein|nr:MAG: hypothetical protein BK997_01740 [Candidatus Micrarchaeum sp. ARMAN-1]